MEHIIGLLGDKLIRGVSKLFGEWSNISTATWDRCACMHMAIQRYVEERHLA